MFLCLINALNKRLFAYILDGFFVFQKMQNQDLKYKQIQNKRKKTQKNKNKRKRKTHSVWLCLILPKCAGSDNCTYADRVASYVHPVNFWFL